MAITFKQAVSISDHTGTATTIAPSWTGATTAGSWLIATVQGFGTEPGALSFSAGSWTESLGSPAGVTDGTVNIRTYYSINAASQSGALTITLTNTPSSIEAIIAEWAGVATSSAYDNNPQTFNNDTASTTFTSGSFTTTNANDIAIVVFCMYRGVTTGTTTLGLTGSPSNIWNMRANKVDQDSGTFPTRRWGALELCDKILSSTGSQSTSDTTTGNTLNQSSGVMFSLKAAAGGGFAAKQRKTLTRIGSGIGKRQMRTECSRMEPRWGFAQRDSGLLTAERPKVAYSFPRPSLAVRAA